LKYQSLEQTLQYRFNKPKLLQRALTHASKSSEHLERQEFLGDAVLGLIIAEYLFHHYPNTNEGDLSKMRANLVCKQVLLHIAHTWSIETYLNVGDGERDKAKRLKSPSIAANAVEAVIGAVFEDGGFAAAKALVLTAWGQLLKDVQPVNLRDAKSLLQEITQSQRLGLPHYTVEDSGFKQNPRFQASCFLGQTLLGQGQGHRKKEAELSAAEQALHHPMIKKIRG